MEQTSIVALFGEAEKGDINTIYYCKSIEELYDTFGQPPGDTQGLFFAIQSLLYGKQLLYYRVHEEGLSVQEYLFGLHLLRSQTNHIPHIHALFLPNVGVKTVIEEGLLVCQQHHGLFLMQAADFYDYVTG